MKLTAADLDLLLLGVEELLADPTGIADRSDLRNLRGRLMDEQAGYREARREYEALLDAVALRRARMR